jgi:hypothetical protein
VERIPVTIFMNLNLNLVFLVYYSKQMLLIEAKISFISLGNFISAALE